MQKRHLVAIDTNLALALAAGEEAAIDPHLLDVDPKQLGLLFREMDLPAPIIVSPRELLQKFCPK